MMHRNSGFTLVEILIVVIILGILAAIVIPQFTEASNDARESSLSSDLQTLRSQVELYKIQHMDQYPGWNGTTVAADKFVTDMTSKTNAEGHTTAGTGESEVKLGPYLQKFPANPFVSDEATNRTVTIGTTALSATVLGDGTTGWFFDTTTGKVSPNDLSNAKHAGM